MIALGHAYFMGPHISPIDGSEHATRVEAQNHLLNRDQRPSVTISAQFNDCLPIQSIDEDAVTATGESQSHSQSPLSMDIDTSDHHPLDLITTTTTTSSDMGEHHSHFWVTPDRKSVV